MKMKKEKAENARIYEDRIKERESKTFRASPVHSCVCFDMLRKQIYHKARRVISQLLVGHNVKRRKYRTQGMTFLKHSCTLSLVRRIYFLN